MDAKALVQLHWSKDLDPLTNSDARDNLYTALDSYHRYHESVLESTVQRRRRNFETLSSSHQNLLAEPPISFLDTLARAENAIRSNAELAAAILKSGLEVFELASEGSGRTATWHGTATTADLEMARTTIRQFFRDWSAEGMAERTACFNPVLDQLSSEFSSCKNRTNTIKVLVPGSGLGRLAFDICKAGYDTEANELSYLKALASNFILNQVSGNEGFELYPWALGSSNHLTRDIQFQKVRIPDVNARATLEALAASAADQSGPKLTISMADFVSFYGNADHLSSYNAVVSVFFVDMAQNFIEFVETVANCLKKGGLWINLGPLEWEFEDTGPVKGDIRQENYHSQLKDTKSTAYAGQVELVNDEILLLLGKCGFKVLNTSLSKAMTAFVENPRSLMQRNYVTSQWVARKL